MFNKESDRLEKRLPFILETLKNENGNILFLIRPDAYNSYPSSRDDVLSPFINSQADKFNLKQRLGGMDTSSTTMLENIRANLDDIKEQRKAETGRGHFDRIVISVFTKSTDNFEELKNDIRALSDVSVYVIE